MTIESDNAKEEINEIVEKCIRCGFCKNICPVLKIMREEQYSPRGKAIILDKKNYEKIIFECNLCKACEVNCPLNLKLCDAFIKARKVLVEQNKSPLENKKMLENIEKTGNIYGIKE